MFPPPSQSISLFLCSLLFFYPGKNPSSNTSYSCQVPKISLLLFFHYIVLEKTSTQDSSKCLSLLYGGCSEPLEKITTHKLFYGLQLPLVPQHCTTILPSFQDTSLSHSPALVTSLSRWPCLLFHCKKNGSLHSFIHSSIHSFKYLLRPFDEPGILLSSKNRVVNTRNKNP